MKSNEINEPINKNKNSIPNLISQDNTKNKFPNLFELLQEKKRQNINIDISIFTNKSTLTNLIEKARKSRIYPNFKNQEKQISNNSSPHQPEISSTKPNKKFEYLYKTMKKSEKKLLNNIKDNEWDKEIYKSEIKNQNKNPPQSPKSPNVLSDKTSTSETRTKMDQISMKEKSESMSQPEQEDEIYEEINTYPLYKRKNINLGNSTNNLNDKFYGVENVQKNIINENYTIEYETVKDSYSIKSCNSVLEYSFREDQNIDSQIYMEDKSKSIENFNNNKNQILFELFDGHGGEDISNFLQQNFAQIYKQYLDINTNDIPKSLSQTFRALDKMLQENLANVNTMGSTGTILHIIWVAQCNELIVYIGNVGDSKVSLISPSHIIKLSYDHRMSDEKERKRILESGIEVENNRIGGELMLTRSFGDFQFKNGKKGLICEPFLSKIKIDLNIRDQFLILASDGIWDLITEKDIQQMINTNNDSEKLCAMIIKKALDKEAWDNMSVFAIRLT